MWWLRRGPPTRPRCCSKRIHPMVVTRAMLHRDNVTEVLHLPWACPCTLAKISHLAPHARIALGVCRLVSEGMMQGVHNGKAIAIREVTLTASTRCLRACLRGLTPTTKLWHRRRGVTPTRSKIASVMPRSLGSEKGQYIVFDTAVPLLPTWRRNL